MEPPPIGFPPFMILWILAVTGKLFYHPTRIETPEEQWVREWIEAALARIEAERKKPAEYG